MMATFSTGIEAGGRSLRLVAICAVFALVGLMTVMQPLLGVLAVGVAFAAWRADRLDRDVMLMLLLGNVVLTYGFANVGVSMGIPIPLTEILLLPLIAWCLLHSSHLKGIGLPAALLAAMLTIATLRLLVDFPAYGNLAARDFITPLEGLALIAGFWTFNKYGLDWASRTWRIVFVAAILYALLYPWGPQLEALGPTVGLQKPIPLLGQYQGSGPAIAAAFFFCLLTMKRPWSLILDAFCLAAIALFQARGLYLALPMATVLIIYGSGKLNTGLPAKLGGTFLVAGCLFVMVLPLGLEGRMGPLTASFATEQLGTLLGKEGAGDGSAKDRVTWMHKSWNDLTASPQTMLFGVGLGPDLTDGAKFQGEEAIRKPHNDFLEVLARFGFVGFAVWGAMLVSIIVPIWKTVRHGILSVAERTFMLWISAGVLCYLFIATNQPLLAFPYGTIPVFTMLGMALALSRQASRRESLPEESP